MPRFTRRFRLTSLILGVLLLAGIGCMAQPRKTMLDKVETATGKKLRTTPAELRMKTHHAALPLSGIIEAHADMILAETADPAIRKNALLWKINGIPSVHQAAFQPDALMAFLDLWILSIQMQLFFEEGPGQTAMGRWQAVAANGSRKMRSIIETLARDVSPDGEIKDAQDKLMTWSRENPLTTLHFIRKSVTVVLAAAIGTNDLGTFEVVQAVAIGVADLSQQMNAYANYLPKQARWQTELLLEGLTASEKIDQALSEFIRISRDIDRITALAETAPGAIATERAIILKAVSRDLNRAIAALDRQRIATLDTLEKARIAVMDFARTERSAMSADITAERIALLAEIERQRQETLNKIEALGKRLLDDALDNANAKIDHFFIRTLQVGGLLVFVVLCFYAGAIYYIHGRQRKNTRL